MYKPIITGYKKPFCQPFNEEGTEKCLYAREYKFCSKCMKIAKELKDNTKRMKKALGY